MNSLETRKLHVTCKARLHTYMCTFDIRSYATIMEKSPPKHPPSPATNIMIPATTPVSNLYDSYEFRAISKQLNRAIKGSNSPLSPYKCYLKSTTPFYSKQVRRICGQTSLNSTRNRVLGAKTEESSRAKGFVWRLWTKVKGSFIRS